MALKVNLYRNKNQNSDNFGKVYGRIENNAPIDIDGLAEHMAKHHSVYSKGNIKGVLNEMTDCIKELMLQGQPVKLADLAIFKASAVSKPAASVEKFDLQTNIVQVKLCAQATGILTRKKLTEDSLLEYSTLAQKVKDGEVKLSTEKGKYVENTSAASGD